MIEIIKINTCFKLHKKWLYILVAILCVSCSNKIINPANFKTTEQVELGGIGVASNFVLDKSYEQTGIVTYKQPIKVAVQQETFNNTTYKAFEKAKFTSNKKTTIVYIDSVDTKPNYLKLEIADRISIIEAVNDTKNTSVKAFLKVKHEAHLVSQVSIAFPKQIQTSILSADEIYLQSYGVNSFAIHLYKKGVLTDTIPFTEGVVFSYGGSKFCWKNTNHSVWEIADIVPTNKTCPKGTYRSPKKDKSLNQHLRF